MKNLYDKQLLEQDSGKIKINFPIEDCGIKLYVQPIYMPIEKKIYGFECLLRIIDPELGLLSPPVFMEVVQRTPNVMIEIERMAIREICDTINIFDIKHSSAEVFSINIYTLHFMEEDFCDFIEKTIKETKINPSKLCLELREEVLFKDKEFVEQSFERLRSMGIKIAIDDFGFQFFSTGGTENIPQVDFFKIERSYVLDIKNNPKSRTLVKTILGYAQDQKVDVIAVGVEDIEQESELIKYGCRKMQGFLYSKPVQRDKHVIIKKR